ncbi:hypothetical protein DER45DRAFT_549312 [Fusarium avenaceum]|nr:hypothetical protein DER45DRAFT_549312 [Fusarium avenaceum]
MCVLLACASVLILGYPQCFPELRICLVRWWNHQHITSMILDLDSSQCFIRSSTNCITPSHGWLGFDQQGPQGEIKHQTQDEN